jgi:signal transduction histidine kinase
MITQTPDLSASGNIRVTPLPVLPAGRSLRWRLPLLISGLILVVLITFLWAAYAEVEHALLDAGGGRASVAAEQFASLMAQSAQQRLAEVRRVAADKGVRQYLERPTQEARAAAEHALGAIAVAGQPPVELWTADRTLAIAAAGPPATGTQRPVALVDQPLPATTGIGAFQLSGDTIFYEVIGQIDADPSTAGESPDVDQRLGSIVVRRTVSTTAQASEVFSRLVGTGAVISIGNRQGTVWTDLAKVVAPPGVDLSRPGVASYRGADGRTRVGAVATISRTPWSTWVEFPETAILNPARNFLRRMLIVSLGFLVLGAAVAGLLAASITRPLRELTTASQAIAAGEYSRRVPTDRRDELGRLGIAFNTMTEEVQQVRQELEERVRQRTSQLQAAVNQLESFTYSVSHDLRAPLRAITGFSRILLDEHEKDLPPAAARHLRRVSDGARQMGLLVDDLLAFARLGSAPVRRVAVDPGSIVREVLDDLRGDYADRDVKISVATLAPCRGDPALLKQVYANLLSNALKFSRSKTPALIDIGCRPSAGGTEYFVKDNGVGFDMRYAGKLFGVFQRLHRAEEYEGTGVGLAIVHRVVTRHDGRVWAEAAPDRGACFFFTLGSEA